MSQREWSERLAGVVARELRRHREARGMSAQQLADACTAAGLSIQRSVIANFENGRRASVSVAEVLMFAHVLDVPPVSLICPIGYMHEVEVLPGVTTDPYRAATWVSGTSFMGEERGREERSYGASPKSLYGELFSEINAMADAHQGMLDLQRMALESGMPIEPAEAEYSRAKQDYDVAMANLTAARHRAAAEGGPLTREQLHGFMEQQAVSRARWEEAAVAYAEAAKWKDQIENERNIAEDHREVAHDILQEIRDAGYLEPTIAVHHLEILNASEEESVRGRRSRRKEKG
ncbi:helix-turn-helix domain-containing protein [Streptomyces sp. NPDC091292]|uniref:helix-turn-helix domain-containing protein n=1 Tax=Streptomyces sp. NPDC091292 TaxID=3365991 RepID=UPI00381D420E